MQGVQVTCYVGGSYENGSKRPVGAENIIKDWAPTRSQAKTKKRRMEREHGGIVEMRGRT